MEISERLKIIRKARGLTQENVAQLVGMSYQGYIKCEHGDRIPSMAIQEKMCSALSVNSFLISNSNWSCVKCETKGDLIGILIELLKIGVIEITDSDSGKAITAGKERLFFKSTLASYFFVTYNFYSEESEQMVKGTMPLSVLQSWKSLYLSFVDSSVQIPVLNWYNKWIEYKRLIETAEEEEICKREHELDLLELQASLSQIDIKLVTHDN